MSAASHVLDDLVQLSHELGREERMLAILGEGNTSADAGDGTFYVKGSGSQLGTIKPEQFSRVRTDAVLELLREPDADETRVEAALRAALVDEAMPRPSIETLLHALCLTRGGARFVGHTHAEAVNAFLCSKHGAQPFLQHIFPDAVVVCGRVPLVVPYTDPGLPIAVAFAEALEAYLDEHGTAPKLVLMVNHGIVALGRTARDVLNVTLMAQKWARILKGAFAVGGANHMADESARRIDARLDEHYRRKLLSQ